MVYVLKRAEGHLVCKVDAWKDGDDGGAMRQVEERRRCCNDLPKFIEIYVGILWSVNT